MDLPAQPPPDVPAPPPTEQARKSRRRFGMILLMGVVPLLAVPLVAQHYIENRRRRDHGVREYVNNAREVHKALFEFDVEYGSFPRADTIPRVQADTGTTLPLG